MSLLFFLFHRVHDSFSTIFWLLILLLCLLKLLLKMHFFVAMGWKKNQKVAYFFPKVFTFFPIFEFLFVQSMMPERCTTKAALELRQNRKKCNQKNFL